VILLVAVLHLLVLVLPPWLLGRPPSDARAICFLGLATAFCISELTAGHAERVAGSQRLPLATGVGLLASFWAGLLQVAGEASPVLSGLGGLSMCVGITLRRRAMQALGRWFRSDLRVDAGQPLVTHGIYARMRHPSETGTLLIAGGAATLLASPAALAIVALWITPCVFRRVRKEDCLLAHHFPTRFAAWAERVPALLPRWRLRTQPRVLSTATARVWKRPLE
jgi:protein-S-isoprenylcysteine O-methyltransferase Ste14